MARPCPSRQSGSSLFGGVRGREEKSGTHPEGRVHSGDDGSQVSCKTTICMSLSVNIWRSICRLSEFWREQQFIVAILVGVFEIFNVILLFGAACWRGSEVVLVIVWMGEERCRDGRQGLPGRGRQRRG